MFRWYIEKIVFILYCSPYLYNSFSLLVFLSWAECTFISSYPWNFLLLHFSVSSYSMCMCAGASVGVGVCVCVNMHISMLVSYIVCCYIFCCWEFLLNFLFSFPAQKYLLQLFCLCCVLWCCCCCCVVFSYCCCYFPHSTEK